MNQPSIGKGSNLPDPRTASPVPAVTRQAANGKKYRPSLTAAHINHILQLAKTELPYLSKASISLIGVLAPFQAKIENDSIAAAYTVQPPRPKANSLEALGAGKVPTFSHAVNDTNYESKEQYWQACYELYQANPAACTLEQITASSEHRYINDLMTPEEEKEHEQR